MGNGHRVIAQEIGETHSQVLRKVFCVPPINLSCRYTATIPACRAVDFVFELLRDGLKAALDKVMALHPGAETEILIALLLTQALYLYQVGKHPFILVLSETSSSIFV